MHKLTSYQEWEHYSSIRNKEGPHTGPPEVQWKPLSPEDEQDQQKKLLEHPTIQPWQIDVVRKSLPFLTDTKVIKKALEDCNGNINNAASMLMDAEESGSISSTQESSSVEREPDSDDDMIYGPNKRANRSRIHRATRNLMKEREKGRRDMAERLAKNDGSQESVSRSMGDLVIPDSQENSPKPEGDDDWVRSDFEDVSVVPEPSKPIRLKINPPRSLEGSTKSGKSHVRQQGPHQRGPSARERKELKKIAQKAARKQRQREEAAEELAGSGKTNLPILTKPMYTTPVPVEGGMRTLYI
jgi:OTU domain-containing protein 3